MEVARVRRFLSSRGYAVNQVPWPQYNADKRSQDLAYFKSRKLEHRPVRGLQNQDAASDIADSKTSAARTVYLVLPWDHITARLPVLRFWRTAAAGLMPFDIKVAFGVQANLFRKLYKTNFVD